MNTKLSIALLSGISLFMSVGAFAVADERPEDYLNWSYAMGENKDTEVAKNQETESFVVSQVVTAEPTCTEGCPARVSSDKEKMALTLTYEDEAMRLVQAGDQIGAINILYGKFYEEGITEIQGNIAKLNSSIENRMAQNVAVDRKTAIVLNIISFVLIICCYY